MARPKARSKKRSSGRRRRRGQQVGLRGVLLVFLLATVGVAAVSGAAWVYWLGDAIAIPGFEAAARTASPATPPSAAVETPPEDLSPTVATADPAERGPTAPPGDGARVALVIDDLGRSLDDVERLEALGVPVTYAVLPFESRTPAVVAELRRRGAEILLHLPMEAGNGADPGPGALRRAMADGELRRRLRAALEAVPGAVGVNNHMGSVLSADRRAMDAVMTELAGRELFFLDSRTTAATVAFDTATAFGVPAAKRQVFLDGQATEEAIAGQFLLLLATARERGSAIAIGHPYPETLAVLEREVPRARELGYDFVPVSFLVQRSGGLPE